MRDFVIFLVIVAIIAVATIQGCQIDYLNNEVVMLQGSVSSQRGKCAETDQVVQKKIVQTLGVLETVTRTQKGMTENQTVIAVRINATDQTLTMVWDKSRENDAEIQGAVIDVLSIVKTMARTQRGMAENQKVIAERVVALEQKEKKKKKGWFR